MTAIRSGFALRLITPPSQEPVTLDEVKLAIRMESDITADDLRIESLITAARELCEAYTRRSFCQQTWKLTLDGFPPYLESCSLWQIIDRQILQIPKPPTLSVTSISYIDVNGDEVTLDPALYRLTIDSLPARLEPGFALSWPETRAQIAVVSITFVAGYAPSETSPVDYAANVPASIKNAIKFTVNEWFWNCGAMAQASLPAAAQALLGPYRVHGF